MRAETNYIEPFASLSSTPHEASTGFASDAQATLNGLLERADASKADSRALVELKPSADQKQALANAQTLRRLLATQRALTGTALMQTLLLLPDALALVHVLPLQ